MLLDDIGQYLQSKGVGTLGADIFLGMIPDQPDNLVALFEYAGNPPDLNWNGEYPSLQVMVRNTSYPAGRTKIEQVRDTLHGLCEQVINGTRYLLIKAKQSPESLGRDDNNRCEFVINFDVIKEA
jgi:hypothetical protein